jgi:hypothetical protein
MAPKRTPNVERTYSDQYAQGQSDYDLYKNMNSEWISGPGTITTYVSMIIVLFTFLHFSGFFDPSECWTVVNAFHTVGTFIFLHWVKGNPDDSSQGDYNGFTVYEQMQAGIPYTKMKKFLMIVPALLCWIACYTCNYKPVDCVVNGVMFLICVIPKVPEMHRVRVFGINETTGIDDEIEFDNHRASPTMMGGRTRSHNKLN